MEESSIRHKDCSLVLLAILESQNESFGFFKHPQNKFTSITDEIENGIKVLGEEANDLKSATATQQFNNVKEG